jgi:hypothetical protein
MPGIHVDTEVKGRSKKATEVPDDRRNPDDYISAQELRAKAEAIRNGEIKVKGRDPVRVAAGLDAAATRKERGEFPNPGDEKPISQGGNRDTSRNDLTRRPRRRIR